MCAKGCSKQYSILDRFFSWKCHPKGSLRVPLESSWAPLGGSWAPLGHLLGTSWRLLEALGDPKSSKVSPKASQRPPKGPPKVPQRPPKAPQNLPKRPYRRLSPLLAAFLRPLCHCSLFLCCNDTEEWFVQLKIEISKLKIQSFKFTARRWKLKIQCSKS